MCEVLPQVESAGNLRAAVTLSEIFLNIAEFESEVFPGRAFCAVERQPATVAGIGVETASELVASSPAE